MANNVTHFSIHADDVGRAKTFYETVFGWRFEPWGPPDFFVIQTGTENHPGIRGALQKRAEPVDGGVKAFECTVSVEDVDAIAAAVEANGGKVIMSKMQLPTVGWLIKFEDTEGNVACAMNYEQPPFGS
jgi:predicted enzyme related to lactoylglutathione lyase